MNITLCTHPTRCDELQQAHGDMAAQLAAAQARVQQLQAQLVASDEANAALLADNNRLRMDVQDYMRMFEDATRKAVRV